MPFVTRVLTSLVLPCSGFHLSALVVAAAAGSKGTFKVAVTFDRGRIIACNCTCGTTASWCSHVVVVCLHRIHQVGGGVSTQDTSGGWWCVYTGYIRWVVVYLHRIHQVICNCVSFFMNKNDHYKFLYCPSCFLYLGCIVSHDFYLFF